MQECLGVGGERYCEGHWPHVFVRALVTLALNILFKLQRK
jgi:hypothetical protein